MGGGNFFLVFFFFFFLLIRFFLPSPKVSIRQLGMCVFCFFLCGGKVFDVCVFQSILGNGFKGFFPSWRI